MPTDNASDGATRRPAPFSLSSSRSLAEEQIHRKQQLAAGFRLFGRFGFDEGVAGHITARDPLEPETFWVNPFGLSFKQIRVSDLIRVSHTGEVVEGSWPVNQAAFAIHSQIHRARQDAVAAAHSHSPHGRALSALQCSVRPLTQDACAFFLDHARFDDYTGVVNDPAEGARIAQALGSHKALILANHGLLTVGTTVESAIWWYISMERTCQVQLMAMAAGTPHDISHEVAEKTREIVGSEAAGTFSYYPLFNWISEAEPDLFT